MGASLKDRVNAHRQGLRNAGLRPIQIWVPDTRRPGFADECARQSQIIAASYSEKELLDFVDEASLDVDELK